MHLTFSARLSVCWWLPTSFTDTESDFFVAYCTRTWHVVSTRSLIGILFLAFWWLISTGGKIAFYTPLAQRTQAHNRLSWKLGGNDENDDTTDKWEGRLGNG